MKNTEFKVLSDRDHILARPAMWIGSIDRGEFEDWILENGKFIKKTIQYVPAFLKIINEVLDNSVDVYIRTQGQFSTKIKVSFENDSICIEDNGTGIEVTKTPDGWIPELAWTKARSGVNFTDERQTIGANGVGSFCVNVFSTSFIGETYDGSHKCVVTCINNAESTDVKVSKCTSKQGTKVTFVPDLKRFKLTQEEVFSENSIYQILVYQRLLNLSICYPGITFYFNGKAIRTNNLKSIMSLFGENFEFIQNENYVIGIFNNPEDEFKFFSCINGLRLTNGGAHIDVLMNDLVSNIREKLVKRYKSIKPGEIKSKLFLVFCGWNFKNPKFDSQTKERLTNSTSEIREFLGNLDIEAISKRIIRNKELLDPIIEIYKIKEEFANRKAIDKEATPKTKKVVSKKWLPATIRQKYCVLSEGSSASGSLSRALGREDYGFFELRGVPISAEKATLLKFLQNEEMKLLGQIMGIDFSKSPKLRPDSPNWYKIEINNEEVFANENDMILVDGKWVTVEKLLTK